MIQRIQSVYLFLSSLAVAGLHFLPFGKGAKIENSILDDALFNMYDSPVAIAGVALSALVLFIAIFLFKNRVLQGNIVKFGMFSIGILIGGVAYSYFQNSDLLNANDFMFSSGMALPIVGVILASLAANGIKKDEKTVKSMDRLR